MRRWQAVQPSPAPVCWRTSLTVVRPNSDAASATASSVTWRQWHRTRPGQPSQSRRKVQSSIGGGSQGGSSAGRGDIETQSQLDYILHPCASLSRGYVSVTLLFRTEDEPVTEACAETANGCLPRTTSSAV